MKFYKWLCLIMFIASLSIITALYIHIVPFVDKLTFDETTYEGNIEDISHMSIDAQYILDGEMYWNTSIIPSKEYKTSLKIVKGNSVDNETVLYANMTSNFEIFTVDYISEFRKGIYNRLIDSIDSNVSNGESYRRRYNLKDYLDHYPIQLGYLDRVIDFKGIPLNKDYFVDVSMSKNDQGEITYIAMYDSEQNSYHTTLGSNQSIILENKILFSLGFVDDDGVQIINQNKLYYIEIDNESAMDVVYSFDDDESITLIEKNDMLSHIYIVTQNTEGTDVLYVLDSHTFEPLQVINAYGFIDKVHVQDNAIVVGTSHIALYVFEDGKYNEIYQTESDLFYYYAIALLIDGEDIYIVSSSRDGLNIIYGSAGKTVYKGKITLSNKGIKNEYLPDNYPIYNGMYINKINISVK